MAKNQTKKKSRKCQTGVGTIKKLKVGAFTIDILYHKKITAEGSECLGLCIAHENKIFIEKGMEQQKRIETILHELIHWISENYSLGLCEKTVNTLAVVLVDFINKNPRFIQSILKGVKK